MQSLQHIRVVKGVSSVVNSSDLGKAIARCCKRDDVLSIIMHEFGHGFMDVGYWTLAEAIQSWSNGDFQVRCVYNVDADMPTHVVAWHPEWEAYADADGLSRADELITKMRRVEDCEFAMEIRTLDSEAAWDSMMCLYHHLIIPLRKALDRHIGDWSTWRGKGLE